MGPPLTPLRANLPALENGGRAGLFWSCMFEHEWISNKLCSDILSHLDYIRMGFDQYIIGRDGFNRPLQWRTSMLSQIGNMTLPTTLLTYLQYHLSLNCALPKRRQLFNYASGWLSFVSCQASAASSLFLAGRLKQPFIALYVPDFTAQGWQSMLLVYPGIAIMMLFNIHGARLIPILQNIGTTFHVLGLIAIAALLWTLGPHVTAGKALLTFTETGGWSPTGLALMIGQISKSNPINLSHSRNPKLLSISGKRILLRHSRANPSVSLPPDPKQRNSSSNQDRLLDKRNPRACPGQYARLLAPGHPRLPSRPLPLHLPPHPSNRRNRSYNNHSPLTCDNSRPGLHIHMRPTNHLVHETATLATAGLRHCSIRSITTESNPPNRNLDRMPGATLPCPQYPGLRDRPLARHICASSFPQLLNLRTFISPTMRTVCSAHSPEKEYID